jgi:hypothetical protein
MIWQVVARMSRKDAACLTTESCRHDGRMRLIIKPSGPTGIGLVFGHVLGTNENGFRILLIRKPVIWCGEGDLNPHEIAPASTSS